MFSNASYEAASKGSMTDCISSPPVELGKYWHALHYLITGDTGHTLLDGIQIKDVPSIAKFIHLAGSGSLALQLRKHCGQILTGRF
jgi:hypothetical protein